MLGLLITDTHIVLKVAFVFDEIELADEFNEVVTAETLAVFLGTFILEQLIDENLVFAVLRAAVFAEDVELHELKPIVGMFTRED